MRLAILIVVGFWLGLTSACEVAEEDLEGATCNPGLATSCGTVLHCDQVTKRCKLGGATGGGGGGSGGGGGGGGSEDGGNP